MQFPQIRMTSQMAKIQINQQPAVQTIRQPNAALSIQQPQAELNIHTTKGKLTIDQTQAFEDMNLMNVFRLTEKFAQAGREAALQGAERRAQQGEQLMKIENGGNPIAEQAVANSTKGYSGLGIKFIPSHFSVKEHYEPADVHIDAEIKQPQIEATTHPVQHDYQPGKVTIAMKQYQSLQIDVEGL